MSSGYLERQRRMQDEAIHMAERVTRQYDMDCWQIALARYDKLELGYQMSRTATGYIWTGSCRRSPGTT